MSITFSFLLGLNTHAFLAGILNLPETARLPAMVKKDFVSIYFNKRFLQLVKLDKSRKKVAKHLFVSLPEGIIDTRRVLDVRGLAAILKNAWKKGGFKELSVGIVVPEFATLTKSVTVPELESEELDEAIRWQAQEYLPWTPDQMVLDWKILSETNAITTALVVAIEKTVLQGFVDATSMAGFFPLVVENPAMALVRIADGDDVGKIIVYEHFNEGLLVVARGQKIVASSVLSTFDGDMAVGIGGQLLTNYANEEIAKVVFAGGTGAKKLADEIAQKIQKPVEQITQRIAGLPMDAYQEFLLPLALQLQSTTGPSDPDTVNLLPTDWAKRYDSQKLRGQLWGLLSTVSVLVFGTLIATIGVYFFFTQQIASFTQTTAKSKTSESTQVVKQVADINSLSSKTLKIQQAQLPPQELINLIIGSKPTGITITGYKMKLDVGAVEVIGVAANLQDVINFKSALEANEHIDSVSIPISNFEGETDIDFDLSFSYKK